MPPAPRLGPNLGYAILMTMTFLGIQVVCGSLVSLAIALMHGKASTTAAATPIVTLVANSLAFATILAWGASANRESWRASLPAAPLGASSTAAVILSTVGLGAVLSEAGNLFTMILPIPESIMAIMRSILNNADHPALSAILVVVFAPITEEILFRGLILRGLLSRMRAPAAIATSALLFALVHANPWQFIGPLALGVLFGWWYVRTRSLIPCILGHAVNNALALACRHSPIDIPGLTGHTEQPVHQPWAITLGGAILLLVTLWWFDRATPPATPPEPPTPPVHDQPPLLA